MRHIALFSPNNKSPASQWTTTRRNASFPPLNPYAYHPTARTSSIVSAASGKRAGRDAPSPPKQEEEATTKNTKRIARILQNYASTDLESQHEEAKAYIQERAELGTKGRIARRASRQSRPPTRKEELEEKHNKMFFYNPQTGREDPKFGVYGEGKVQWWSLWVQSGREKQVAEAIDRMLPDKEMKIWIPKKVIKAWSPKTNKMGTKTLKYENGGWMLIQTVMDGELNTVLDGNYNFLGYRDKEVFNGVSFPLPTTKEVLDLVDAWEKDVSEMNEDQVRESLGMPPKSIPRKNNNTGSLLPSDSFIDDSDEDEDFARNNTHNNKRDRYNNDATNNKYKNRRDESRNTNISNNNDSWQTNNDSWSNDGWYSPSSSSSSSNTNKEFDRQEGDNSFGWFGNQQEDQLMNTARGGLLSDDDFEAWEYPSTSADNNNNRSGDQIGGFEGDEHVSDETIINELSPSILSFFDDDDDDILGLKNVASIDRLETDVSLDTSKSALAVDDDTWDEWSDSVAFANELNPSTKYSSANTPPTTTTTTTNNNNTNNNNNNRVNTFVGRSGESTYQPSSLSKDYGSKGKGKYPANDGYTSNNRYDNARYNNNNNNSQQRDSYVKRDREEYVRDDDDALAWWDDAAPAEVKNETSSNSSLSSGGNASRNKNDGDRNEKIRSIDTDTRYSTDDSNDDFGVQERKEDRMDANYNNNNNSDNGPSSWWDDIENDTRSSPPIQSSITKASTTGSSSVAKKGSAISVVSGPFKDFDGVVLDVNEERGRVNAEIDIFGRKTVVEVGVQDVVENDGSGESDEF